MFLSFWHAVFFDPIYNGLVYCIDVVPGGDVGVAIILITVLVKVLLLPLSLRASRTQHLMREIEPKIKEVKEKHKENKEEQARAMMAVYRDAGINPFASILLLFIQIPIIIALYLSVYSGGGVPLPAINTELLYRFVPSPTTVNMLFVGIIDMAGKSLPLALLAGITQFMQARLMIPPLEPRAPGAEANFKDDFTRSMNTQMRYVMPIVIFVVAYSISAAIALYFTISNLAAIAQEYFSRSRQ